jgi:hypothetical protein
MNPVSKPRRTWLARQADPYGPAQEPLMEHPLPTAVITAPPAASLQQPQSLEPEPLPHTRQDEHGSWKFAVRLPPAKLRDEVAEAEDWLAGSPYLRHGQPTSM